MAHLSYSIPCMSQSDPLLPRSMWGETLTSQDSTYDCGRARGSWSTDMLTLLLQTINILKHLGANSLGIFCYLNTGNWWKEMIRTSTWFLDPVWLLLVDKNGIQLSFDSGANLVRPGTLYLYQYRYCTGTLSHGQQADVVSQKSSDTTSTGSPVGAYESLVLE